MSRRLWAGCFCALMMEGLGAGCGSNAPRCPDGGAPGSPACPPTTTGRGTVTINPQGSDGTVSGSYSPAEGGGAVTFTVTPSMASASEARYSSSAGSLTSRILGDSSGTLLWGGIEIDGSGVLSAAERAALTQLASSNLATAIAMVPLELGCRGSLEPVQLAALLMPWQTILKYLDANRLSSVKASAAQASCVYFQDIGLDGGASPSAEGQMRLANDTPVPNAFGFFPFDGEGAQEPTSRGLPLVGDAVGPCGALCRGACGPDCPSRNCTRSERRVCQLDESSRFTGVSWFEVTQSCGIHQGCVDHDQCYDDCNESKGCGSWSAAMCRRGCDRMAIAAWGPSNTSSWMRGGGPYQSRIEFVYLNVDPMSNDGQHCPVGGMPADAGADGGQPDAGTPDAGSADGGIADAGTSDGGPLPPLGVDRSSLIFQTTQFVDPPAQTFRLINGSGTTLSYSISDGTFWLFEEPLSGTVGTSGRTITAWVSVGDLAVGSYEDTITITSPEASNSPVTVQVVLNVRSATDGGTPADGGAVSDGGSAVSDAGTSADGGAGYCCCRFDALHYCGQRYDPCWNCVFTAQPLGGDYLCGTQCNAPPEDQCVNSCP